MFNFLKNKDPAADKVSPIRCTIEIHTDKRTGGSKDLPLLIGTSELPAKVRATITLDVDEDHSGNEVNIEFKASTTTVTVVLMDATNSLTTEEPFKINRWKLPVTTPKPGIIAKGTYTKYVEVDLNPSWPSSCSHNEGWVKYAIRVQYQASGRMCEYTALEEVQEIWVLNSVHVPSGPVLTVDNLVKNKSLSMQISIPSAIIAQGQVVPVTARLAPFLANSKYAGQEPVILWASCKIKETRTIRARGINLGNGTESVDEVLNTPMNTKWPQGNNGWEHTVHVTMPSHPVMATDMATKFLDINHTLVVTVKLKAGTETDIQAEEYKFQLPIKVVAAQLALKN
ncbi:hypothetical protein BGZ81_009577 [Podila clonocystis]|nr:hypothetical protein BGZ81_009577 [Podila clonocystis]